MAKKKQPDKLSQEVAQALACGMSYGKWKAMQQPVKIEKKPIPDGWKECKGCGKPFKPHDPRQKYCDTVCRSRINDIAFRERRKEIMRKYREKKKED